MKSFSATTKFALAVSGGIDSMVMLDMFIRAQPTMDFFVVTVNHNIRDNAQDDCDFVNDYCAKRGIICKIVSVDVPKYAIENKLSTETAARILRYKAFDELNCDYICTAHHACDNAETVLMHILRGSGGQGASGIAEINGRFFRPLLCYTRNDIEQYAKKYNIPYVTDQTNTDNSYNRNFLRNDIFPRLTKINSNAIDNINRFASHIADDEAYLSSIADITSVSFGDECTEIPLQLLTLPRPIAMRIINKTLVRLGCTYDIESTHIEALLALSRADGGKQVDLPFGFVAYNDYDHITIERRDKYNNIFFSMPFTVGQTTTPCGIITVTNFAMDSVARWFDIDKIGKEAVIRNQLSGDVFQKFGSGTKKLVDFFTDKKIPYRKRNSIPLVAIGNEVLIVGDIEISEKIKGTTNSNIYYFNITKEER